MMQADSIHVSSVSLWEIAIKARLGKIQADPQLMIEKTKGSGFLELAVLYVHALEVAKCQCITQTPSIGSWWPKPCARIYPCEQQMRGCLSIPAWSSKSKRPVLSSSYQTRQAFAGIIGCPVLHPKAWPNSGMFCTTPLMRNSLGE